ncbi:hypothetical protein [Rickettsia helvetica]|uniref:Uncharacterized protein n=1 Tax=Rickettsia helvetica TaxID=35789 RepID=A0ABM9N9L9_RICHE|nr:hypothetical protein [Rickettsia helvetica]MCZ6884073.1 hypothetical protein [Rickettsia endosymbiont of Ixodes ricinus]MCZ6896904.1 hypothetical protein [Rickettsia endosymbiont of Ixodes ricinus]
MTSTLSYDEVNKMMPSVMKDLDNIEDNNGLWKKRTIEVSCKK